jgi:hypothetical protein
VWCNGRRRKILPPPRLEGILAVTSSGLRRSEDSLDLLPEVSVRQRWTAAIILGGVGRSGVAPAGFTGSLGRRAFTPYRQEFAKRWI